MPRGKSFDPAVKLDAAVQLFWRQGYEATGVQDIVDTLGVSRGSLYATFGDKDRLWMQALHRYCEVRSAQVAAVLDGPGPVRRRIRTLLGAVGSADGGDPLGCLLVNAIAERGEDHGPTRTLVRTQLEHVTRALTDVIAAARDTGELPPGVDPVRSARHLAAVMDGLSVLQRSGTPPGYVDDVIEEAVRALDS